MSMVAIYYLEQDEKIFYVGYTKNPKTRIIPHRKKFGNDIEMKILEYRDDYREAEKQWIDHFRLLGYELENVYEGGNGKGCYPKDAKQVIYNLTKWLNAKKIGWNFESTIDDEFIPQLQEYYDTHGYDKTYKKAINMVFDALAPKLFPKRFAK